MEISQTEQNSTASVRTTGGLVGRKNKAVLVLTALFLVTVIAALYLYRELSVLKQDPQRAAQEEAAMLTEKVGHHMVLPENEQPTIATVTDPEKLKDQPFFANAKIGSKVLIYTNAKKAILFDEENDKILEVAPLNIGNP